ncbi:MAG: endospore germination permease [Candidatus Pristimantibacillus lignocellulolyticus]|uniref:Endospore germination permease n=1 Tax=Candidatus Pristimantibacillus lignocellulolyticus TaxID=2994561 RepID=A0A9J6ZG14_9BACL|nr:MAG: endospore germination permease [Candidatus Pristimantibacillus lignocellulolyticus]
MDHQRGNITIWLSISIIILSAGIVAHVMSIPVVLNVAGRDSWVSVIIAAPFFIIWFLIYNYLIKQLNGQSYIEWTKQHWGNLASWIVKLILAFILFFSAFYSLLDTMMWAVTTYMVQTPFIVVSLFATVICVLIAYCGLQSIAIVASLLLPVVMFLGYFVASANMKHKDWDLLFPIFDKGYVPAISGSLYVISALMEIWVIMLYSHHIKQKMKWWQTVILALFLLMMVMGPTTGGITEFGPDEASKQRHTAFDQWKILSLGEFLQHVDFLSIYQWLSGSIVRISISMYLMVDLFQIRKNNYRLLFLSLAGVVMIALMYLPWREDTMLSLLQHIYFPGILIFVVLFTLLIGVSIYIIHAKERRNNEGSTS